MSRNRANLRSWCIKELSKITDCADDITDYVFKIESVEEIAEYLREFFGESVDVHHEFIENLVRGLAETINDPDDGRWIRKDKDPETSPKKNKKSEKRKEVEKEEKKKPTRFVPLYSREGEAKTSVRLPGRHPCECLAQRHALINNCISCGRIVCEQEGAGPCYFCGELVCSNAEQEVIARNSKKSAKLMKQLMMQTFSDEVKNLAKVKNMNPQELEGYQKAIEHKNKLLDFDKTSARRTKVIDDDCDYYSTNSNKWLSAEEKKKLQKKEEEIREKRHGSRRNMQYTLDFAGRKVVEENGGDLYREPEIPVLESGYYSSKEAKSLIDSKSFPDLKLEFKTSNVGKASSTPQSQAKSSSKVLRVQDKELQEMRDPGMCLSMHQPWASLLVAGIKKVEGRSWYTAHRGRLWIAATVKNPEPQELSAVENMYRDINPNTTLKFPKTYPTACLLGSVDMVDCLSNEDYKENCADQSESESPFVFICENPRQLLIKIPVKGQHKIWKLESHLHKEAKMAQMF